MFKSVEEAFAYLLTLGTRKTFYIVECPTGWFALTTEEIRGSTIVPDAIVKSFDDCMFIFKRKD